MAKHTAPILTSMSALLDKAGRMQTAGVLGSVGRAMAQAAADKLGQEVKSDWQEWDNEMSRIRNKRTVQVN